MKRIQLYLNEDTWKVLQLRSRQLGTSVSALVREAVREKYGNSSAARRQAMQALVGLWKDRRLPDSEIHIRRLRKSKRTETVAQYPGAMARKE